MRDLSAEEGEKGRRGVMPMYTGHPPGGICAFLLPSDCAAFPLLFLRSPTAAGCGRQASAHFINPP